MAEYQRLVRAAIKRFYFCDRGSGSLLFAVTLMYRFDCLSYLVLLVARGLINLLLLVAEASHQIPLIQ